MTLTIRPIVEADLNILFVHSLNLSSKRLVNRKMWSLPLLRRMFYRRTELGVPQLLHLCTSIYRKVEYTCVLVNFRDVVMGLPEQYGWDLAGRWLFYDVDLLGTAPFKAVERAIAKEAGKITDVQYTSGFLPFSKVDTEWVKSLKGNYTPHVYGEKSKQYKVRSYFGMSAVSILTQAVMCFGIQRAERFITEGQNDVMPELYDLPMQLAGLGSIHGTLIGCVSIEVDDTLVGAISMYIQGGLGEASILYLHEVLIDPDPKWKSLSLAPLLHIHGILEARRSLQTDVVFRLGYNFADGYQGYKDIFRPHPPQFFNVYTDMHAAPGIPLKCFKEK